MYVVLDNSSDPEGSTGQIQVKLDNSEWIQLDISLLKRISPPHYESFSLKMPERTEIICKGTENDYFLCGMSNE